MRSMKNRVNPAKIGNALRRYLVRIKPHPCAQAPRRRCSTIAAATPAQTIAVDPRFGGAPVWLVEVVSIRRQRSQGERGASIGAGSIGRRLPYVLRAD